MKGWRIYKTGGSDVLMWEDLPTPAPGPGQILLKHEAIGINFSDISKRVGRRAVPLPATPGAEGAGVVEAVGSGVDGLTVGERVAYTGVDGAYAEFHLLPANRAVKLPPGIDSQLGAAIMLQGMTAHYLSHDTYPLQQGDSCLIHAGAGGTGLLLIQMARMRGATVFATVSTAEKAALAAGAGAQHVINYREQDFAAEVERIAGPAPLHVVYDSVGKDTFDAGFKLLRPRGMMVLYGQASGPVPPVETALLAGSKFLTRPMLGEYIRSDSELQARAAEVMAMVTSGHLKVRIGATFPLSQAPQAMDALQTRQSTGKLLLIP